MDEKNRNRILILLVAVSFAIMYVVVNARELILGAVIYLVMFFFCIFMYSQWGKFGKISDLEGLDDKWGVNALLGVGLGVGTIILGKFIPFIGVIGIPSVQSIAGIIGKAIIIIPVASTFEATFFNDFLQDFFESKLKLPKYLSIILVAIGFALFHLTSYGGSLVAAGGSFFTAGLMGFIFGLLTEWRNSLAINITYHAILNTWIGFVKLNVIIKNILPLLNAII